jgi:hypothetical protein
MEEVDFLSWDQVAMNLELAENLEPDEKFELVENLEPG